MATIIASVVSIGVVVAVSSWRLAQARHRISGTWIAGDFRLTLAPSTCPLYVFPASIEVARGTAEFGGRTENVTITGMISVSDPRVIYKACIKGTGMHEYNAIIVGRENADIMEWIGGDSEIVWDRALL